LKKRIWLDILPLLCAGALLFGAVPATTSKKKKSTSKATASSSKKSVSTGKRRSTRKPVASWRNTQRAPTPERYKEIQQALASKGYLHSDTPSGVWDDSSVLALKKFQQDQNLEPSGKLDSLSIIALGLGPKHEQPPAPAPKP
jgi:peptidoglycan hydrolase-like protein with peptidoglycan-binding domain